MRLVQHGAATDVSKSFIRVDRVSKTYRALDGIDVTAVEEASFDIRPGEFVSVVGPSGCGKTTLLKMVGGLMEPTTGTILYDGSTTVPNLGIVFQDAVLLPWRSVIENVLLPAEIAGKEMKAARDQAMHLIDLVGLRGFEGKYPAELSGGMQQRVSIARSLLNEPKLLLMDEPFGALDAMTREQMAHELERIWSTTGSTIIFITHSIPEAVLLSDRVFAMTSRPSRLAEIIEIDLPRERSISLNGDPRFIEATAHIRQLMKASGDL